ncbi:hypothetical protein D9M68_748840 [compost metagenome]
MLQAADGGAARGQRVLLGHGQDQFGRQVRTHEIGEIHFGQPLVVDGEVQARAVLVGAVQVNGAGTHQQVSRLEVLRQCGARAQQTECGNGNDVLLHVLPSVLDTGTFPAGITEDPAWDPLAEDQTAPCTNTVRRRK